MTGSEVERTPRTASRPLSVPFAGVTAFLLPTSQGAEGRKGRCAGLRWSLRAVVLGGFAGAAWLLSGAAAHAAGPEAPTSAPETGAAVVSLVNGLVTEADALDATQRTATSAELVEQLLAGSAASPTDAAPKPAGTAPVKPLLGLTDRIVPVHGADRPSDVADRTDGAPASPVRPDSGDTGTARGLHNTAADGLQSIARVLAAPFRLTDGPAGARGSLTAVTSALTEPLRTTLHPVTRLLHQAASVTDVLTVVQVRDPSARWSPVAARPPATVHGDPAPVDRDMLRGVQPGGGGQAASGRTTTAQRFTAGNLPGFGTPTSASGARSGPGHPEPAPTRVHLGTVSGVPATGPGGPEGGSVAAVASSFTGSAVADHRLPATTGSVIRPCDAAAPTFSPD